MATITEVKDYIRANAVSIKDTGINFRVIFADMETTQRVARFVTENGWPCSYVGGNIPGLSFSFETL